MGDSLNKEDFFGPSMSLADHLEDLRRRLIKIIAGLAITIVICLIFGKYIIAFMEKPYLEAMGQEKRLQVLSPAEGFNSYMQIAGISGIVLASPWIFYHLWMFISAGLYPREKRYVYMAIPFSVSLFVAGALLFFFWIARLTLQFFVTFNKEFLGVDSNFTFPKYISFMSLMMLIFGLAFQTPIAVFFLIKTGLVSIKTIKKVRMYVILGIVVVVAAVIPGSDPFSLFATAIPVYLLFELGVFLARLSERKRQREEASLQKEENP